MIRISSPIRSSPRSLSASPPHWRKQTYLLVCLASSDRGQTRFKNLLHTRGADGVMLMALRGDDPLLRLVEQAGLPAVVGGRPLHGEPAWYVDADNRGGARMATDHLIGLGRTRIAAITGLSDTPGQRSPLSRISRSHDHGRPCPHAVAAGDFTEASGAAAMTSLLGGHPHLDAVFAANDNMAAGALRVLREAGHRVPDEVAVVGFDDLAIALHTDPPLTTVHQSIQGLGREMTRLLLAVLAGQEPSSLILPTRLVVRESA